MSQVAFQRFTFELVFIPLWSDPWWICLVFVSSLTNVSKTVPLIHRAEGFGSRLRVWFCPIDGRREGSSKPAAGFPDCEEHHPRWLRSG